MIDLTQIPISELKMLSTAEAAEILGQHRVTLTRWRTTWTEDGECLGPQFILHPNGRVCYPEVAVLEYLQSCLVQRPGEQPRLAPVSDLRIVDVAAKVSGS